MSAHLPPKFLVSRIALMSPTPHPFTLGSRYIVARTQSYTARVLSTSACLPPVIARAVSRTIPSVGISQDGAIQRFSAPVDSLDAIFFDQSRARSRVRTLLVSSR